MCLLKTDAQDCNKVKIFKFTILTPPKPKGHMIPGKHEQPLDEDTD